MYPLRQGYGEMAPPPLSLAVLCTPLPQQFAVLARLRVLNNSAVLAESYVFAALREKTCDPVGR